MLKGSEDPVKKFAVYHSCNGKFAIRKGDWVFIDDPCGGDNPEPEWYRAERGYEPHAYPGELFNLKEDGSERKNRYGEQPEVVEEMKKILTQVKAKSGYRGASKAHDSELTE